VRIGKSTTSSEELNLSTSQYSRPKYGVMLLLHATYGTYEKSSISDKCEWKANFSKKNVTLDIHRKQDPEDLGLKAIPLSS
jgi:hypothetical protein